MKGMLHMFHSEQLEKAVLIFIEEQGCIGCIVCRCTPVFKKNCTSRQSRSLAEFGIVDSRPGTLAPHPKGGNCGDSSSAHFTD